MVFVLRIAMLYISIPFSILDFCPIRDGETARDAFLHTVEIAQFAEGLGYRRYWLSEHHGSATSASSATAVMVGHLAGHTSTIRVGSGGVMLPNHTPFLVAEQYGTLESLYPGRIDLGIGRATGSCGDDVSNALRWTQQARERFPDDLRELQSLFRQPQPRQRFRAVPGAGLEVPIWLLASSAYSAQMAAQLGLPLAYRLSSPAGRVHALSTYRNGFQASVTRDKPYTMVVTLVAAADTDEEAQHQFQSAKQLMLDLLRSNRAAHLRKPIAGAGFPLSPDEKARLDTLTCAAMVGSRRTVQTQLAATLKETAADEVMALSLIYDMDARRRSLEIFAEVCKCLAVRQTMP
jgi:luciferase family oxidoreductase group 1